MMRLPIVSLSTFTVPIAILTLFVLVGPASNLYADDIVDHPDKLEFEELDYTPPRPADYRHTLKSGVRAYIAENRELPTFERSEVNRVCALGRFIGRQRLGHHHRHGQNCK